MKKNKEWQMSMRSYLFLIFCFSILAAISLACLTMWNKITENAKQRIIEHDAWLISQLCESAEYLSSQAENISASLAFDDELQSAMIAYEYGKKEKLGLDQIRIQINNNLFYKSKFNSALYDCANIVLFSNSGDVIGSKERFRQNVSVRSYPWFSELEESNGKSIWLPLGYDVNSPVTAKTMTIPVARKIFATQSNRQNTMDEIMTLGQELGYIVVYMNASYFSDLVAEDISTKKFFLLDDNKRIISCREKSRIGETLLYEPLRGGYVSMDGMEYVMTQKKIPDRGWNYVCFTDRSEVEREGEIVVTVCILLGGILILLFTAIGFLISQNIAIPVTVLIENFRKAENGKVTIQERTRLSEFKKLYESFNYTMDKIHDLANQVYENKLVQQELIMSVKESRIQALQMQINPHFLYNTLDCINWKAQLDGNKEVAEMIRILGRFFRSNMENKGEFTTLKDEVDNIELYLALSKLRFGSRLNWMIDIDEALYPCCVMKLLLQPLVENAIKHGLEVDTIHETIWIWCGEEDSDLVVSVKDDGKGMDGETLQYLRNLWENRAEEYKKTEGIGLYNVMRRLYLSYQENCSMEIFSELGKGTEIVITFSKK